MVEELHRSRLETSLLLSLLRNRKTGKIITSSATAVAEIVAEAGVEVERVIEPRGFQGRKILNALESYNGFTSAFGFSHGGLG